MRAWPDALRALRHRNFRLYFAAQGISTLGLWAQQVAQAWLVYRLSDSAALLGLVSCLGLLPQLLIGPLVGAWIDRHDKRHLLIVVEALLCLQAVALAALTAFALITPLALVLLATLFGVLTALDTPLRLALVSGLVDSHDDLPNALALNATLFTLARFLGPLLAGLLLGLVGEAPCFAFNALSFVPLLLALRRIRMAPTLRSPGSLRHLLAEGLNYVRGAPEARSLLQSVLMVNLCASGYAVLLPVLARDTFAGDALTLGWLWSAAGFGALLASLLLARLGALANLPRLIHLCAALCIAALLLAASERLWLTLPAMLLLGFAIAGNNLGSNIVLQNSAPEALRGRVVALYSATRFGFDALGGLLVGFSAQHLGAAPTLAGAALLLAIYCAYTRWRQFSPIPRQ
ncbi:MFS transporter [Pseudomonas lalucatii]|uniref:MFS transporter n=1 Tax=Pseudomonas lalucatii TaxID=1424203 RepID=A0ABS5Q5M4_9PSED|nr:MFS transporter [Pseudomonas lalucatii]MBS7663618.1 MFS transporter [Pseudomonas lalucatii]